MTKKILGFLIAAAMLLAIVPAAAFAKNAAPASARDAETVAFWDFEADPEDEGWTFTDEDGDGYTWTCAADTAASAPIAASGTHALRSFSYFSGPGALTPDNWAVTPAVELPEGQATLSYRIASYSGNYPETYRIYVFADDSEEPIAVTDDLISPDSMRVFEERTVDLSEFAGRTVKAAFRHYNCSNQFRVYIDDVSFLADEASEPPVDPTEPPAGPELIYGAYFEEGSDPVAEGWQFADQDGDGRTWQWKSNTFGVAYEGTGIIASYSYSYPAGNLNPDNWAISPAVELPDNELSVTFYAKGYLADYCSEHFAVYAGTSDDTAGMTEILPETVTTGSYVQYTADLSDFANETVYIAIRHFNTTPGEEALCVDQFEVWGSEGEPSDEPVVIENIGIENFVEPVLGEEAFVELTVPDGAHYSIRSAEWQWWTMEDDGVLGSGDVFDSEEKTYYMYIEIVPDEGYVFSDNTVITINGDAGLVDGKGWMEYSRYCWLNTVDFFVTEPEAELIGDVDGDGEVTAADALLALRYVMGLAELDEAQLAQADVNGDGEVTIVDSLLIQRYAMGVIESFPVED